MAGRRSSARRLVRGAAALLAAAIAAPHVAAWARLRAARAALGKHHPEEARADLARCARVWAWDARPSVHLLASRACRQEEDFEGAERELLAAYRRLGRATDETAFEWALLRAAEGNVAEVGEYLQRAAKQTPGVAPLVWEALVQGELRAYRVLDAMTFVTLWLDRDPDNPRALDLRGRTYVTGNGLTRGVDDYRRVLELDPSRDKTRWRLAKTLVGLGAYPEAIGHLETLRGRGPDDPDVTAFLARCYYFVGRRDDARAMLDASLAGHPGHGLSLRTRGQFALIDDQKAAAEGWLRRAAAVWPNDYQTQWLLYEAVRQQGRTDEARTQLRKAEQVKEQSDRLSDLQSRRLAESPLDPALHYEMGTLLTRSGYPDAGAQWFRTAVELKPDHRPAHAALAEYYEARGDKEKAAAHREQAAPDRGPPR